MAIKYVKYLQSVAEHLLKHEVAAGGEVDEELADSLRPPSSPNSSLAALTTLEDAHQDSFGVYINSNRELATPKSIDTILLKEKYYRLGYSQCLEEGKRFLKDHISMSVFLKLDDVLRLHCENSVQELRTHLSQSTSAGYSIDSIPVKAFCKQDPLDSSQHHLKYLFDLSTVAASGSIAESNHHHIAKSATTTATTSSSLVPGDHSSSSLQVSHFISSSLQKQEQQQSVNSLQMEVIKSTKIPATDSITNDKESTDNEVDSKMASKPTGGKYNFKKEITKKFQKVSLGITVV